MTSIAVGLKNLNRDQNTTVTFTHVDHSDVQFDDKLDVKLEDIHAEYKQGKVFAEGGQGIIREGIDLNLRRPVAIKTLKAQPEDMFTRGQFLQEARVTAQLSHPAIIPIYSLNSDENDGLHLVMKLVDGKTLKSYLEQLDHEYRTSGIDQFDERKSLMFRLEVILRVCDALDYANSRNIMHCDLKPENILIGEFRETYIMDWGIARQINEPGYDPATWVKPSTISGTPRFLSPEAIQGEHTDQRADIYALGLILFEVVTLREAYMARTSAEVVSMIREGRIAETRHKYGFKIDPDLKAIIAKATAYDRENRYQTVREFATDIRRYMGGEETTANPYHFFGHLTAFAVHHKRTSMVFALACIVMLLLSIGLTCYRHVSIINARHAYGRQLADAMILSTASADYIETNITRTAHFLSAITSEFVFLYETDLGDEDDIPECMMPVSALRADATDAPASLLYSSVYHRKIDFAHFAHKTIHGENLTDIEKRRLHVLDHLREPIMNIFHERLPQEIRNATPAEQNEYLRLIGIPLHLMLFGFPDGQYIVYPGSGVYAPSYDPRARHWYKTGQTGNGELIWGKPYPGNTAAAGYLLSCNSPMLDTAGNLLGVAGFDLHLNTIIRDLNTHGNTGNNVLEKTLLDNSGLILLSTGARFEGAMETNKEDSLTIQFDDADLFRQLTETKYGTITRLENGRRIIYCVNYLPSQDWYYIEKIDVTSTVPDTFF
jgi:serine/threonine-protein kinase